ncbi:hypothetical protein CCYA_CCYA16G4150 [Cyanidiococcus yangmingshanensis]|nr:hypothetical protein CCYA_CCYA16G4150 [Cyanidiococcus yangmingshanensis]
MRSLRGEALSLYRESLRTSRVFTWHHPSGRPWCEVLAETLRKEFEAARQEREPERVLQLLVNGREALRNTQERLLQKQREIGRKASANPN